MVTVKRGWTENLNEIPREIFVDRDLYRRELERVFLGRTWHLIGHVSEVPEPGDFKTMSVGEVEVVVVRGREGGIRTLVNACAHRGAKIVTARFGHAERTLRCLYHMWVYDTDGNLVNAPASDEFPSDFRKEDYGLRSLRTEVFLGCIFVTASDETPPLADYLGESTIEGMETALGSGNLRYLGSQTLMFDCNWKLYAENGYDSYHGALLHGAVRLVMASRSDPTSIVTDIPVTLGGDYAHTRTHYRTVVAGDLDKGVLHDFSVLDVKSRPDPVSTIIVVFPGTYVMQQMDTLQLRYVTPRGVDKTEVVFASFAHADESDDVVSHRVRQASNLFGPEGLITLEDACALQRVQSAAASGGHNVALKGVTSEPPYPLGGEGGVARFYTAYRRLMDR